MGEKLGMPLSPRTNKTPQPIDVKSMPDFMKKEIERLKSELENKDAIISELQNENEYLKSELEHSQRPFNERGAGRKSKITQEIKDFVVELRQNGNSFAEISYICAENSFPISKSTVDRILREQVALNSFQN
jgi:predicted RNase H-like nuclease (RuvC/YqgF family)